MLNLKKVLAFRKAILLMVKLSLLELKILKIFVAVPRSVKTVSNITVSLLKPKKLEFELPLFFSQDDKIRTKKIESEKRVLIDGASLVKSIIFAVLITNA